MLDRLNLFSTLRIAALKCMEACPVHSSYSVAGMGKGQNGKGHGGNREPRWVHLGPWEVDEGFTLTAADRDGIRAEYNGSSAAVRLRSSWGERALTVSGPEDSAHGAAWAAWRCMEQRAAEARTAVPKPPAAKARPAAKTGLRPPQQQQQQQRQQEQHQQQQQPAAAPDSYNTWQQSQEQWPWPQASGCEWLPQAWPAGYSWLPATSQQSAPAEEAARAAQVAVARCESLHGSMVTMYNNFLAELRQHEAAAAASAVPAPLPQQQAQETHSDSESGSEASSVKTKVESKATAAATSAALPQSPKEATESDTQSEPTSPPTQLGEDEQSAAGGTQPPKPQKEAPATAAPEQQADMLAEDPKREIDSPTSPADDTKLESEDSDGHESPTTKKQKT